MKPNCLNVQPNAYTSPTKVFTQETTLPETRIGRHTMSTHLPVEADFPPIGFQEIYPVEDALHRLRTHRLEDYTQAVYIDPLAKPNLQAPDNQVFSLMNKVQEFIASDGQVMLILGDSGAGKSTFNRYLEHQMWEVYKTGDRIPLYINLPALDRPEKDLVGEQLRVFDMPENVIWELKQHRQFLLICDGYDESQLTSNLHTTNLLNRPGQWNAKLLVTCRTQYLGPDYRDRFAPKVTGQYQRIANELFHEAVVAPFSKKQIELYVEKYVPLEPRTWVTKDYMDRLTTIPNLMDLVKNPFLLTLALESLPMVVEGKTNLSRIRVTRVQLYDIFVEHWLGVNKRRLLDQKLDNAKMEALEALLQDGFERNGVLFQKELASTIFQEQGGRPIIDYSHIRDRTTWKAQFFGFDPVKSLLRDSSLLSRAGNQYRFVHRSILEYFLSCTVWGPSGSSYLDSDGNTLSIGDHPLSQRSIVSESSIIQFMAERVQIQPIFRQHLLGLIELSKFDPQAHQAAANAITILVRAGVRFNGADLRGIRIPGADLTGGQFDSAQLQDTDLTGATFAKAWLRKVDFNRALMEKTQFGELPCLRGRAESLLCAFSPNGIFFATVLERGKICVYDTTTWTKIRTLRQKGIIVGLAYSLTGDQLLSCDEDATIRSWDNKMELSEAVMTGDSTVWFLLRNMAFSPLGKQVAWANFRSVRLCDFQANAITFDLSFHTGTATNIAYSPNETNVAFSCKDGTIKIIDASTGNSLVASRKGDQVHYCLAYSLDGLRIASGDEFGYLHIWATATMELVTTWKGHSLRVTDVNYAPKEQWVASASDDSTVMLWDAQSSALISIFAGHERGVTRALFSPDGSRIASISQDRTIRLWDVNATGPTLDAHSPLEPRTSVAFNQDGRSLICGTRTGPLRQYDADTGELTLVLPGQPDSAESIAYSPDGLQVAAAGSRFRVSLWSIQTGTIVMNLFGHSGKVNAVAFSPCGRWIVSGSSDQTVRLWSSCTGMTMHVLTGHRSEVISVAVSPDSHEIASRCQKGELRTWDVVSGSCRMVVRTDEIVNSYTVAYLPGSFQVVSNHLDGGIRLWDKQGKDYKRILRLVPVINFAFSSCGRWIATSHGRTVLLWSFAPDEAPLLHQRCKTTIEGFFGNVESIVWRPNKLEFATACLDGSTRVWKVVGEPSQVSVQLAWSSGCTMLAAPGALLTDVMGLSTTNRELLEQRGVNGRFLSLSDHDSNNKPSLSDDDADALLFSDSVGLVGGGVDRGSSIPDLMVDEIDFLKRARKEFLPWASPSTADLLRQMFKSGMNCAPQK
ncbi:hypothetical protein BGW39_000355 [Mortierella sp. 14UC]|nr:hypothetical protein BGW39_000355 [Mortierella sp. 14UC]